MKHALTYMGLAAVPALFVLGAPANARSIDETVSASPNGTLEIENVAGSVELEGWGRNEVSVTGELGDDVETVEIDTRGNRVVVKVVYEGNSISDGADLVIRAPAGSKLDVQCVSADVTIKGFTASQRVVSVSGDLRSKGVSGDAYFASVSGDVNLTGAGGEYETSVKSVSGDLRLQGVGGEVEAKSVSGDVIVDAGTVSEAKLASTSGDLVLRGNARQNARIEMKTISGDADVKLGDLFSGEIQAKTATGDIDNCFGPDAEERDRGPGARLSFTEGTGDGELRISTMSGDVDICR